MKLSHISISTLMSVGMISVCSQNAQAQLFTEGFDYTAGTGIAGGFNPGNNTIWTGGNPSELQIGSSQLTYAGLQERRAMTWFIRRVEVAAPLTIFIPR